MLEDKFKLEVAAIPEEKKNLHYAPIFAKYNAAYAQIVVGLINSGNCRFTEFDANYFWKKYSPFEN